MHRPAACQKRTRGIIFLLAAVLLAGSAQAEWVLLGRDDAIRYYFDQKSILKNGDLTQIVQLLDFTSAQWVDARTVVGSLKMLIEYDCAKPRLRALASETYSEQMADGRLVSKEQYPDPKWDPIEPGTTPDKIRQIACARK